MYDFMQEKIFSAARGRSREHPREPNQSITASSARQPAKKVNGNGASHFGVMAELPLILGL